jgi:hypothetical protein
MTPDLEAHGPYVVARRGETTQQVADCSVSPHGAEYARLFAQSQNLIAALREVLKESVILSADYLETFRLWSDDATIQGWPKARWKAAREAADNALEVIAAATGKGEPS